MIKCKIDRKKNSCKVSAKGELTYIATETIGLIATIYESLKERNPEAADEYKRVIQASVIDPKSPLFKCKYFE